MLTQHTPLLLRTYHSEGTYKQHYSGKELNHPFARAAPGSLEIKITVPEEQCCTHSTCSVVKQLHCLETSALLPPSIGGVVYRSFGSYLWTL